MTDLQHLLSKLEVELKLMLKGEHSSLHLSFNDQNGPNYMSVAESIEQGLFDHTNWVSNDELEMAAKTNSAWTLHWYPDTPVGFCSLSASSLPALLKAAFREESDE